jgi:Ca2+-binding RTX toxin-like protein
MERASGVITFTAVALGLAAAGLTLVAPATAAPATCDGRAVTIAATADNQDLTGTNGPDVISTNGFAYVDVFAGGGDDVVCTRTGDPPGVTVQGQVYGEGGNDTLISSATDPLDRPALIGGDGDDLLQVDAGAAGLSPGPGDDTLRGPAHLRLVDGRPEVFVGFGLHVPAVDIDVPAGTVDGEGHDTFTGQMGFGGTQGADVFTGGPGPDFYSDGAAFDNPDPGSDAVTGGGGDDVLAVVRGTVRGGPGDDTLYGGHGKTQGGPGRDSIYVAEGGHVSGGPGADVITTEIDVEDGPAFPTKPFVLDGGAGPDRIFVTSPSDQGGFHPCPPTKVCSFRVDGGPGADVLSFQRTGGDVHLDLARGRATYVGGHATVREFEAVEGSARADILRGTRRGDHLDGNGGPDRLFGRGGRDLLHGGNGHDVAFGGPGRDRCVAEVRHSC